jgi:hypothetical protein
MGQLRLVIERGHPRVLIIHVRLEHLFVNRIVLVPRSLAMTITCQRYWLLEYYEGVDELRGHLAAVLPKILDDCTRDQYLLETLFISPNAGGQRPLAVDGALAVTDRRLIFGCRSVSVEQRPHLPGSLHFGGGA